MRRAQLDFDRGKATFDQNAFEKKVKELETLKRCAEVNRMYEGPKLVVEYARPITSEFGPFLVLFFFFFSFFPPLRLSPRLLPDRLITQTKLAAIYLQQSGETNPFFFLSILSFYSFSLLGVSLFLGVVVRPEPK